MSGSFEVIPGAPGSRVILHVPHSSRAIPDDVRAGIVLDDAALEDELDAITDAHTDRLAEQAAEQAAVRPWLLVNRLSRLVVDPERFPDESEEMNAVGMGAVYTRTTARGVLREPSEEERSLLVERYFHPYARAMSELVSKRLDAVGAVTILDVHSYPRAALPYELHGDGPRPEVCLGTDTFHTPAALVDSAREVFGVLGDDAVGLDSPFAGAYVPLDRYGVDRRVSALMLETRRDVVASEAAALSRAMASVSDHCEEPQNYDNN